MMMSESQLSTFFAPVSAQSGEAIDLSMQRLWLIGRVLPAGARLLARHTFRSGETKPLEVVYSFGLPRDAALRRFRIKGMGFSVSSDLKPAEEITIDLEILAGGHSTKHGAFRAHMKRLAEFLERSKVRADLLAEIVDRARSGRALPGDWPKVRVGPDFWKKLERALKES
jgi:hypothetical protein